MYRLILVALALTGCSMQSGKPIADNDHNLLDRVAVVSTLGDNLYCSFVGLTVFNNKSNTYELGADFNQNLSSRISEKLNSRGMDVTPLSRDVISFIDDDIGARDWSNIKFEGFPAIASDVSSIVILDGEHRYNSTGGYYARNNALNTLATLYVYEVSTGRLIGEAFSRHSTLKRSFSCTQESISDSDEMLELIDESGAATLEEAFGTLFMAQDGRRASLQAAADMQEE
ncbi:hypothetical protein [uncultured Microbulbifer sp.]|uniref:hypothetical protein n=1 Tax=uncultured Microbulbifer sp. TaxID=348147 RepID=UPI0025F4432A|nr:hypothetical protein [uncultured Microbulbifer sp.]